MLDTLPCSKPTLARLRRFAAAELPTVLALCGPSELALSAAEALASAVLPPGARGYDLHVARHDKDRWSVEEVEEKIVHPSALVPMQRSIVVVQDAHRMEQATSDRLLKLLEEPAHPTTFILCVPELAELSATLQSRVGASCAVDPADTTDTRARLQSAGVERTDAALIAPWCVKLPELVAALETNPSLAPSVIAAFGATLFTRHPATDATNVAAALDELAAVLLAATDEKKNDTALRAKARALCSVAVDLWREQIGAALRSASSDAELRALNTAVQALDELEAALWRYRPLAVSLVAAFSAANR